MPFENNSCQRRIGNFFQGEGSKFRLFFQAQFFPKELIMSNLRNKRTLGGSGGMFPRKKIQNLLTVMAILVLFEQFQAKFVYIFGLYL